MTPQEIFDKSACHLLTQNAQSLNDNNECRYRDNDGKKCALGIFIPDELYELCFENLTPTYRSECPSNRFAAFRAALSKGLQMPWNDVPINLLSALQAVHDNNPPDKWPDRLRAVAHRSNLDASAVT